jgi:enoyl-[acyl-carrier protein] reductase II
MGPISNRYTELVGIDHPIVQEGLGPWKTARLAAAVSEAGGLGTVSVTLTPSDLHAGARIFRSQIDECASFTSKPFAVNIPVGVDASGEVLSFTDLYLDVVLEARRADAQLARQLSVLTTAAGFPGPWVRRIKDAGLIHQHKVGTTQQALKAQAAGVDVVIASGFEMGGHASSKMVHTFVLVPSITESVHIPVVLSGGARDARTLAAALCLGADAVALGTRFVISEDNTEWHPAYIEALLHMQEGGDVVFDGNYGPCRGMRNAASEQLASGAHAGHGATELISRKLDSMRHAQADGDVEHSLVLTGQVAGAIRDVIKVAEFVPAMAQGAADILSALAAQQTRS